VLDFEKRSATENYFDTLPKEIQEAIQAKRAEVGMTKEQVRMALGQPRDRIRETRDGEETEDWIYGLPPGKITFVTFTGQKVTKVKDTYAGLGGQVTPMPKGPE
jgi:outer membrane protein assembly factor BamE (lipoprotein component of BamABCDE complex)